MKLFLLTLLGLFVAIASVPLAKKRDENNEQYLEELAKKIIERIKINNDGFQLNDDENYYDDNDNYNDVNDEENDEEYLNWENEDLSLLEIPENEKLDEFKYADTESVDDQDYYDDDEDYYDEGFNQNDDKKIDVKEKQRIAEKDNKNWHNDIPELDESDLFASEEKTKQKSEKSDTKQADKKLEISFTKADSPNNPATKKDDKTLNDIPANGNIKKDEGEKLEENYSELKEPEEFSKEYQGNKYVDKEDDSKTNNKDDALDFEDGDAEKHKDRKINVDDLTKVIMDVFKKVKKDHLN